MYVIFKSEMLLQITNKSINFGFFQRFTNFTKHFVQICLQILLTINHDVEPLPVCS